MTSGLRMGFVRRGWRCVPLAGTDLRKLALAKAGLANEINVTHIKPAAQIEARRLRNAIELNTGVIRLGFMLTLVRVICKIDGVDSVFCAC